jgi:hypothetical protein
MAAERALCNPLHGVVLHSGAVAAPTSQGTSTGLHTDTAPVLAI